jgi:hypothetical protein
MVPYSTLEWLRSAGPRRSGRVHGSRLPSPPGGQSSEYGDGTWGSAGPTATRGTHSRRHCIELVFERFCVSLRLGPVASASAAAQASPLSPRAVRPPEVAPHSLRREPAPMPSTGPQAPSAQGTNCHARASRSARAGVCATARAFVTAPKSQ